jgi:hypothetical protein
MHSLLYAFGEDGALQLFWWKNDDGSEFGAWVKEDGFRLMTKEECSWRWGTEEEQIQWDATVRDVAARIPTTKNAPVFLPFVGR